MFVSCARGSFWGSTAFRQLHWVLRRSQTKLVVESMVQHFVSAAPCSLYLSRGSPCSLYLGSGAPCGLHLSNPELCVDSRNAITCCLSPSSMLSLALPRCGVPWRRSTAKMHLPHSFPKQRRPSWWLLCSSWLPPSWHRTPPLLPTHRRGLGHGRFCGGAVSLVLGEVFLQLYFNCLGSFDVRLKLRHLRRRGGNALLEVTSSCGAKTHVFLEKLRFLLTFRFDLSGYFRSMVTTS